MGLGGRRSPYLWFLHGVFIYLRRLMEAAPQFHTENRAKGQLWSAAPRDAGQERGTGVPRLGSVQGTNRSGTCPHPHSPPSPCRLIVPVQHSNIVTLFLNCSLISLNDIGRPSPKWWGHGMSWSRKGLGFWESEDVGRVPAVSPELVVAMLRGIWVSWVITDLLQYFGMGR